MADSAKEDFSDLIQRFIDSLAAIFDRLPFDLDRQRLRSLTTFAALSVVIVFAWKLLRAPPPPLPENQRRQQRRRHPVSGPSNARLRPNTGYPSSQVFTSSGVLRVQDAVDEFFRPLELTLEQHVRQQLSDGRKRFIKYLLHISPDKSQVSISSNVYGSTSLDQFFGRTELN